MDRPQGVRGSQVQDKLEFRRSFDWQPGDAARSKDNTVEPSSLTCINLPR